jgi:hypothetical protein
MIYFLFILSLNLYEWSGGRAARDSLWSGNDSVHSEAGTSLPSGSEDVKRKKIERMMNKYRDTVFADTSEDCGCNRAKIIFDDKQTGTVEIKENGTIQFKDFKIPVTTYVPLKNGKEKIIESTVDLDGYMYIKPEESNINFKELCDGGEEIESLLKERKESKVFQEALSSNNFTMPEGEVQYSSLPEVSAVANKDCFDLKITFFLPPRRQWFECRGFLCTNPKWCQYIARSEFKVPVAIITAGDFNREDIKGTFGTESQFDAQVWNIYNERATRAIIRSIDRTVSSWLRAMSNALRTFVPFGINYVELETHYDKDIWPKYPYFDTRIDPLWGSKRTTNFPNVLSVAIPPALHDYYVYGPFAIVLMVLADINLSKSGTSLSQIDCARLSGGQIGGNVSGLWNWAQKNANPSSWVKDVPGTGTFARFVKSMLSKSLNESCNYYCVGCWGYLFPRTNSIMLSSDYQAFALTAYKALSKLFDYNRPVKRERLPWPHIVGWKDLQKMRANGDIYFQLSSPKKTGCFQVGTTQLVWENRVGVPVPGPDKATFIVWRRIVLTHNAVWDLVL